MHVKKKKKNSLILPIFKRLRVSYLVPIEKKKKKGSSEEKKKKGKRSVEICRFDAIFAKNRYERSNSVRPICRSGRSGPADQRFEIGRLSTSLAKDERSER